MTSLMFRGLTAAAIAAGLCFATPSLAQDGGSTSVFERMFGRKPASGSETTGQVVGQESATDQVLRIERLEAQIRQMTGTIEQLQHRNRLLEAQIRSMGGSIGGPPGSSPLPPAGAAPMRPGPTTMSAPLVPPVAAAPGRRSDVFDPTQNPNAPGAPRPLGGVPGEPPAVVSADPPVGAPGGRNIGAPLDLSSLATGLPAAAPSADPGQPMPQDGSQLPAPPSRNLSATGAVAAVAPPTDSPKDWYDLGYGYVLRKDYALAEDAFQSFLTKYPKDRRAPDAQFWLGESQFQRQRYDVAASSFLDLSTKHSSHGKAPDALLRLAQSLAAMKQKEMACATLAEVTRKYPRASNSVKQSVVREQKRVHC